MLPVLLNLGFIKIYTFGVFLVLAFFWGAFFLWKNTRLTSYKEEDIFDGLFLSLTSALFFARLLYIFFNFSDFGFDILKFILINGYPGLSFYGALFGGIITLYVFAAIRKINLKEIVDYFVPSLFLALGFGKLGAFFAGSEVGSKIDGSRHLTAVYEAILFFIAAAITQRLLFDIRREKYPHGFLLTFCLWYISATIFLFDKLKASHLYLLGFSFNKIVSFTILLTTTVYFIYYFRSSLKNYGRTTFKKIRGWTTRAPRK